MLTECLLSLCLVWPGDGAGLNQPRPESVRPAPSAVVPVGHVEDADWSGRTFVPPAPLPKFDDLEAPQLRFELSRPESCTDSRENLPAPPMELDVVDLIDRDQWQQPRRRPVARPVWIEPTAGCDDPGCAHPAEQPATVDQLLHLQSAIRSLQAAGMPDTAEQLRFRHRFTRQLLVKEQRQDRMKIWRSR